MGSWPYGHQRNIRGTACLPKRMFWKIIRRQIIFRHYYLIYIYVTSRTHKKQVAEDSVARCVMAAVTVTVTSCDRVENGCGIP
jgi:hypothetical protein